MKRALPFIIGAIHFLGSLGILDAQWLETTMLLPDSLGGLWSPYRFTYNATNQKVYVGGTSSVYGNSNGSVLVIDAQTYQRIGDIEVGTQPQSLIWNQTNNKIYCANGGGTWDPEGTVTIIDGEGDVVITNLPVGQSPCALVWNSTNNKIYCANRNSDDITVIDGTTDAVLATIPVGDCPRSLAWNSTSNKVYCANAESNDATVIDCETDFVIASINVGSNPQELCWNAIDNKIYCACEDNDWVAVIAGQNDSLITTVPVGYAPRSLVWNSIDNKVYCANYGRWNQLDSTVTIISGVTNNVMATINAGWIHPSALVWNAVSDKIYCASKDIYDFTIVTIIDGERNSIIATIKEGSRPGSFVWDSTLNRIYHGNDHSASITIIDGDADEVIAGMTMVVNPFTLEWNSTNNKIYCANSGESWDPDSTITVIDAETNEISATINVGLCPSALVWNSDVNKLFCANYGATAFWAVLPESTVTVIDGNSDSVIATVVVGSHPCALVWNSTNNKVYCANHGTYSEPDSTITVLDGQSGAVVASITVGIIPYALIWNSVNNKIYCAHCGSPPLTVIDGQTDSIIGTIAVDGCGALAWSSASNKVYCAHDNAVTIIDSETDSIITTITVGGDRDQSLCCNLTDNKIYYVGSAEGDLLVDSVTNVERCPIYFSIIDGQGDTVITSLEVMGYPSCLLWNSINDKVYCPGGGGSFPGSVLIICGEGDTIMDTVQTEDYVGAMVWDSLQNRVYGTNPDNSSISVIRDEIPGVVEELVSDNPIIIELYQSYPNPFSQQTSIEFQLSESVLAEMSVYNVLGQRVRLLFWGKANAGRRSLLWDGCDNTSKEVSAGVYFVKLQVGKDARIKKLLLIR